MPHFEWLGVARVGPPMSGIWVRVLLGLVVGWLIAGVAAIALSVH